MPKPSGLRVVWLEAFVVVAGEGSQEAAAKEMVVDQATVSRYVGALEVWLRKALLDPAVPGQLWPDGEEFLMTALEVLKLLKNARGGRSEGLGKLRIEWLEDFVARAENGKQAAAAAQLGVDQPVISRHLKSLSEWLGERVIDKKRPHNLLPAGEKFLLVAQEVLRLLDEARASLPSQSAMAHQGPSTPTRLMKIPGRRDD